MARKVVIQKTEISPDISVARDGLINQDLSEVGLVDVHTDQMNITHDRIF